MEPLARFFDAISADMRGRIRDLLVPRTSIVYRYGRKAVKQISSTISPEHGPVDRKFLVARTDGDIQL